MKKILLFLTVIGLSLASCSTDEPITDNSAMKTANVYFTTATETTSTPAVAGKQIKKPSSFPDWVNGFSFEVTSAKYPNYVLPGDKSFTFDQQNGADNIVLNDVAIGSNTFNVTTTTDSPKFYEFTSNTYSGSTPDARFDNAYNAIRLEGGKDKPYIIYTGSKTATISGTDVNLVNINMGSKYGRVLAIFQLNEELKTQEAYAVITVSVTSPTGNVTNQTATTRGNELVTFKFSNEYSVAGAVVTYNAKLYSKNGVSLLKIYDPQSTTIGALKNHVCYYTLNSDGVVFKVPSSNFTLDFPPFETVKCQTGDCK